jgi:hypothetical protein
MRRIPKSSRRVLGTCNIVWMRGETRLAGVNGRSVRLRSSPLLACCERPVGNSVCKRVSLLRLPTLRANCRVSRGSITG